MTLGGKVLVQSSHQFESIKNPRWEQLSVATTSTFADRWILLQNNKVRLIPADLNSHEYLIGYLQTPTVLSSDTDAIDSRIFDQHQEYLRYAAAAFILHMKDDPANIAVADNFMKIFYELITNPGVVR